MDGAWSAKHKETQNNRVDCVDCKNADKCLTPTMLTVNKTDKCITKEHIHIVLLFRVQRRLLDNSSNNSTGGKQVTFAP